MYGARAGRDFSTGRPSNLQQSMSIWAESLLELGGNARCFGKSRLVACRVFSGGVCR